MDPNKIPANPTDEQLAELDLTRDEYDRTQKAEAPDEEAEAARVAAAAAEAETKRLADEAAAAAATAAAAEAATAAPAVEESAAAAPAAQAAPAPAPRYEVGDPEKIPEKLAELDQKQAEAFKKLMEGELTQEDYEKSNRELRAQERSLVSAQTLHEANVQAETQAQGAALKALAASAEKQGVKYETDVTAQKQFDIAMNMAAADPENASLSFAQLLDKAHGAVLAMRGISAAAPPPPPAPPAAPAAPAAVKPPPPPQTLSSIPAAAATPVGTDLMTTFANMNDPEEAEAMLAAMPAAQRSNLLRSTVKH